MDPILHERVHRRPLATRLRDYFIAGLLALGPSALTLWVLFQLFNRVDNLLGRYLRFEFLDYHRIPGLGLIATVTLLVIVGWVTTLLGRWVGGRSMGAMWEAALQRIPGLGILYGSTRSLGEALFAGRQSPFKQVVLVPWPSPGIYRVGFITARPGAGVRGKLGEDFEVVFIPHSPNPASGFVQYVPTSQVIRLDWPVEDGLKVVVSGGVIQPGEPLPAPAGGSAGPGAAPAGEAKTAPSATPGAA